MRGAEELERVLSRIDGSGYKAYRDIRGRWLIHPFVLFIDHVQGDPYASPSRARLRLAGTDAGFPAESLKTVTRRTATEDVVARAARAAANKRNRQVGTGKGGLLYVDAGGQEILPRTAANVCPEYAELRLSIGLPARGRRVMGREATRILLESVPEIGRASLYHSSLPRGLLSDYLSAAEDHAELVAMLPDLRLVSFVADGSVLPRESGISQRPLPENRAVKFRSPDSLMVEVELPNRGRISGMGVPEGVTLIAGGGFHGKSTLLEAVSLSVYPHVPGDGRELVATRADTVKVCAEDGRRVERVDISAFIDNLPGGIDTTGFSTENASGSTSQASYIVESVEMGARAFLIDEDISATNFLLRDARMQLLIPKDKEPITPYIDVVRPLLEEHGVSTVLVLGGAGDYLDVADTVIAMEEFVPHDVTGDAARIAAKMPTNRRVEGEPRGLDVDPRFVDPSSLDPRRGKKPVIKSRGLSTVQYGATEIDLTALMQLVDESQTRSICEYLRVLPRELATLEMRRAVDDLFARVGEKGLEIISRYPDQHPGDLSFVRTFEVAGTLNRLRKLRVAVK